MRSFLNCEVAKFGEISNRVGGAVMGYRIGRNIEYYRLFSDIQIFLLDENMVYCIG